MTCVADSDSRQSVTETKRRALWLSDAPRHDTASRRPMQLPRSDAAQMTGHVLCFTGGFASSTPHKPLLPISRCPFAVPAKKSVLRDNMTEYRPPHVLICGSDAVKDSTVLPMWEQLTMSLVKTFPMPLRIDVAARLDPGRDVEEVKQRLTKVSDLINCDALTTTEHANPFFLKPHHTHIVFCGIEPHKIIPSHVRPIYLPTPMHPAYPTFPFDRLGYHGFIVMRETEARRLLDDMDPETAAGSAMTTLRARCLVRALAAHPALEALQGIVVARGEQGINGCVASSKVLVPPLQDDDDDIDQDSTEERYEFDIPKPIIEKGELEPRGAYSAFVGKFIGSLILDSSSIPPIDVHSESQFSFQLEMACVAAAITALTHTDSPMDLETRIPTLQELTVNITQYIYGRPLLLRGEEPPSNGGHPVRVRISWPAPPPSPPPSPAIAAAIARGFRGIGRGMTF